MSARRRWQVVTDRLNAVYADGDPGLDPELEAMQHQILDREDW